MPPIDRVRLKSLMEREQADFARSHPKSKALFERARKSMMGGVPMNWMSKWPGGFPVFVSEASGARFKDVDGREYVDLCLGDTGAMTGHAPAAAVSAITRQLQKGVTTMLPGEDALWVSEELQRRFGLPYWQFALTATDANRFSLRLARLATGRSKIVVFNYCYHGTVDEAFATIKDGRTAARSGNIGPAVDPSLTSVVVELNDVPALEKALATGEIACVLAEPAMTNVGIVLPDPGYHQALRDLTRKHGTLLIIDETHTICAGPGGYTKAHGLSPDFFVLGKPLGSGIPTAVYGMTAEVAETVSAKIKLAECDTGGIGGTLAGSALSMAAMRATLEHVLTDDAFRRMIPLAERFTDGVQAAIREAGLDWHVSRLGCRAEYLFGPQPKNGGQAAASADFELERFMHLYALNRGVLLTPFHNMALMSPATTAADVDRHTDVFRAAVRELVGQPAAAAR
jgi:glutamate-1-semialdehyde 2,1-aminomutase